LATNALAGAKLGVWRPRRAGAEVAAQFEHALDVLRRQGATLEDLSGFRQPTDLWTHELAVLLAEFKAGIDAYLASTPADVKVRSLSDLIAFNRGDNRELALFGQELFEAAEKTSVTDSAYVRARSASRRRARKALDTALSTHVLDAIVTVTGGPSWRIDL